MSLPPLPGQLKPRKGRSKCYGYVNPFHLIKFQYFSHGASEKVGGKLGFRISVRDQRACFKTLSILALEVSDRDNALRTERLSAQKARDKIIWFNSAG